MRTQRGLFARTRCPTGAMTSHGKTTRRTAVLDYDWKDPRTGVVGPPRRMSRFKRRRFEAGRAGQVRLADMRRAQQVLNDAAAVTKDVKARLKAAAEGR